MANIKANGTELINTGDSFISLTDSYLTAVNNLFNALSKINKTAWSGSSADAYVSRLAADKLKFTNFGNNLKLYGEVIKSVGNNIDAIIGKWDNK